MNEVELRFPVNCPLCARELLTELSIDALSEALTLGSTIRLHANCHRVSWDANPLEVEQIRQYFCAVTLSSSREGN
jgi:hypothetical protein